MVGKMKLLFFICCILCAPGSISAQNHTAVDIDDPVYLLLESGELKGSISRLSLVKPYSYSQISDLLLQMEQNNEGLSSYERKVLAKYRDRFIADRTGWVNGNVDFSSGAESSYRSVIAGLETVLHFRLNTEMQGDWHMYNLFRGYLKGDFGAHFSYYGSMGFTFDRVGFSTFAPYSFTKEWDAFHIGFGEPRYSNTGAGDSPYFSYNLKTDLAVSLFDNNLAIRVARHRRNWGYGDGSFSLSGTARPFIGFDIYARPAPWVGMGHLTGSLGNWLLEGAVKGNDTATSYQKNYTLQTLEFFPTDWLSLSANASVVWGKRFELGYLVPMVYSMIYQNLIGDFENVGQEVCAKVMLKPYGSLYLSFFADEMEITNLEELFVRPRNMFAFQVGGKASVPGLPFTIFSFQYTKIEPFVYAHYPEDYPFFSNPVDMTYTHDGENLGYRLPPNSDEWLVRIETLPHRSFYGSLTYQLIRHGTNDPSIKGDLAIYGDVSIPLVYGAISQFPDKNYLYDGMYDWNNIVTLSGSYTFDGFPITLTVEYCFAHTFWRANNSGISEPEPQIRNIFLFKVELWR